MEATREACKMAMNDNEMPQWYRDGMAELERRQAAERPSAEQPAQPPALSAEQIADEARRLTDVGISASMAAIMANPAKRAEFERMERRREIAGRLGVDVRYLPEGLEDGD